MNAALDRVGALGAWMVLPLALLLAVQWPLRDAVGAGSQQANDLAQCLFALYVGLAMRQATRRHLHLAAGTRAARRSVGWHGILERFGHALAVLPFALFVLVNGAPLMWRAVSAREAFPETLDPGYFIIKGAAWLLALLVALQSAADLLAPAQT